MIQRQNGFAMIEVMVTVVIITIGISGMGMLLMRAIQGTHDSAQQSQAMWIVQDYIGRMRANPDGALARFYELNPADIDCTAPPAICAETYQDGAEVAASTCANTDAKTNAASPMASFDNWITTCGLNTTIYDSASDFVVNPELTSTCTSTSPRENRLTFSASCVQYQVTLTWDTKIKKGSTDENERTNKNNFSMIVEFN
jgi:type IV pilus modification protein PilV